MLPQPKKPQLTTSTYKFTCTKPYFYFLLLLFIDNLQLTLAYSEFGDYALWVITAVQSLQLLTTNTTGYTINTTIFNLPAQATSFQPNVVSSPKNGNSLFGT